MDDVKDSCYLQWQSKQDALELSKTSPTTTFKSSKQKSKNYSNTKHTYIEGDNLEALKLLKKTHTRKIKVIYIDPPYNTGNNFIYNDNYGNNHSAWLSMIYPRLKVASTLLLDDGIIFISIDDNEVANLRKVCDEIFGEENFVEQLIWQSGRTSSSIYTREHEYILCYAKDISQLKLLPYKGDDLIVDRAIKRVSSKNKATAISFEAGVRFLGEDRVFPSSFGDSESVEILSGVFECKDNKLANAVVIKAGWSMKTMIQRWQKGEVVKDYKGQIIQEFFFKQNGILQYSKKRLTIHPKSIITNISARSGAFRLKSLLGYCPFEYPKPPKLIMLFLQHLKEDEIVLDFFSGSATTADAVLQLNASDGGKRRYIIIQEALKDICDIAQLRIKKVGEQLQKNSSKNDNLDVGFRVLECR